MISLIPLCNALPIVRSFCFTRRSLILCYWGKTIHPSVSSCTCKTHTLNWLQNASKNLMSLFFFLGRHFGSSGGCKTQNKCPSGPFRYFDQNFGRINLHLTLKSLCFSNYRPRSREIMYLVASVHLSVTTLPAEPLDLRPEFNVLRCNVEII